MLAEDLRNPRINCISLNKFCSELFFRMAVFLLLLVFVTSGSPFPSFDLTFVDQLGGSIYWRHDRHSIFNQHLKGLNQSFTYHYRDMTLILVTKQTSKENTETS